VKTLLSIPSLGDVRLYVYAPIQFTGEDRVNHQRVVLEQQTLLSQLSTYLEKRRLTIIVLGEKATASLLIQHGITLLVDVDVAHYVTEDVRLW
jgi:hypothetical protein